MKTLLASLLVISSSAIATDCNVNLKGDLSLEKGILTLSTQDNQPLVLDGTGATFNGNTMSLNTQQQQLLNQYHQQVSELAPQVAGIAMDAVELASEGINSAFGELLGYDDELVLEFSEEMSMLKEKVSQQLYAEDGSIRFNSVQLKDDKFFGPQFESEIEQKVKKMVARSMGSLMMAMGKQMLSSGGDMKNFEQRMENFGENLEQRITSKAEIIEKRADSLCYDLARLDDLEQQISHQIPDLSELDIVRVEGDRNLM
ncbi:DUF2884 family protein [Lacimicrobium alkaliphilum]|uniref:Chemotaxis protein n=1 Tax=Lacimicrobium alkaliphilum TaxID=1526571 RepID=A0A0U2ZFN5_9ALTE|nr:DUF2884 family protein [Lacimicrobium alkaliphilum]ALS97244.1 hypothetical protein AT746_02415 [Lacimicrobium alkaliphilum]